MSALWNSLLDVLEGILRFFQVLGAPLFGEAAWGWAIILLTVVVRLVLLPLAVKQTRSQRAMQRLQPEMKKVQAKFKVDKSVMRSDPQKYQQSRQKQQEAMMGLYKEHGVNPAAGCLPLLAQMPIFFALFSVLRSTERLPEFREASFYVVESLAGPPGGLGAVLLIGLMAFTTYYSSKQMMASTAATGQQLQQQRLMMYFMPVMLVAFSFGLPVGVLMYWVTTNVWTIGQQYFMFRDVAKTEQASAVDAQPAPQPAVAEDSPQTSAQGSTKGSKRSKPESRSQKRQPKTPKGRGRVA